jgi:hypothetical protein
MLRQTLSHYQVLEEMKRGGMDAVYHDRLRRMNLA